MQKELYAKIEIPASLLSIYQELATSPVDLPKNHALNIIRNKIISFETEDRNFREKYVCDFEHFKARVEAMENQENFEWEDDLMNWEYAVTNLKSWRRKERMPRSR